MPEPVPSPFTPPWLRGLDRLLGRRPPGASRRLDAEELYRLAGRRAGRTELGPGGDDALRVLERTCRDVEANGRLTTFGHWAFREFLLTIIAQRLRVAEVIGRRQPEHDLQLAPPLFVTGWYRSGTTFLHHLLAQLPWLRALSYWELRNPTAQFLGKTRSARFRGRLMNGAHRILSPRFRSVHPIRWDGPEECMHLFDHSLVTPTPAFLTEAQEFVAETSQVEMLHAYRFYRDQLQLLHPAADRRRLLLKWPYHLFHLDTLLEVFPGARVIWIHRDPVHALPSVCSLTEITRAPFCRRIDRKRIGELWFERYASGLAPALELRRRMPASFLDLTVEQLAADPAGCAATVAAWCDAENGDEERNSIASYLTSHPVGRSREHRYTAATYGLDAARIRDRFSEYSEICAQD